MPDYIFMLESRLMPDQLRVLNFLQEESQDSQLNLYLVGGAVRDLMTGFTISDLDFVCEGNPLKLVKRFRDPAPVSVEIDDDLKAAEIVLANGVRVSIEMARSETYDKPGGRPNVRASTIIDDLRRRDFTINAMGISLTPGSRGLMLDPTNGLADIENQDLRTLHNYSFLHDPSRLLRMVRYGTRLGFKPEERTREHFDSALERGYLGHLGRRHLRRELFQIGREAGASAVVRALQAKGMLEPFHRGFQRRGADYDSLSKYQKNRARAEEAGYRFDPFLGTLYYIVRKMPPGDAKRMLRQAGVGAGEMKTFQKLLSEAKKVVTALGRFRKPQPVKVYRMLEKVPVGLLVFILTEFRSKSRIQSKVSTHLYKHRPLKEVLPVADLESLGVQPGAEFDSILTAYFERQLQGKVHSGSDPLKVLRKIAGIPEPVPEPPPEEPPEPKEVPKKARGRGGAKEDQQKVVRKELMKKVAAKAHGKKAAVPKKAGQAAKKVKTRPTKKVAKRAPGKSKKKTAAKTARKSKSAKKVITRQVERIAKAVLARVKKKSAAKKSSPERTSAKSSKGKRAGKAKKRKRR